MTPPERRKADLDTPCLMLDLDILETNLQRMQATVTKAGKRIRPHAKTHKCSALAKKQMEAGAVGICAAKVSEAEALVKAGLEHVLLTGPAPTPAKIARIVNLLTTAPSLMVALDHAGAVATLDAALRDRGLKMDVLLDMDVGQHRTGAKPAEARALAEKIIACETMTLRGVQAYAGQVQHIRSREERASASRDCLQPAVQVYRELRALVPMCDILSTSGTGTFDSDATIPEITDLQVGSYVLMDTDYLDNETPTAFAPAMRVLTTVISANQDEFVTVDAGLKTVYRDGGTPRVIAPADSGLQYSWFGDEYGKITSATGAALPPVGAVLELVASHCDPTVNLFDHCHLTRGESVVGTWSVDLRGCSQ